MCSPYNYSIVADATRLFVYLVRALKDTAKFNLSLRDRKLLSITS